MAALVACVTSGGVNADLRAELETMFDSDQSHRLKMQEVALKHGSNSPEVFELWKKQEPIDKANLKRLGEIVAAHGWPAISAVGQKASAAAFLIVQHSDPTSQKKYLPVLRAAVESGEAQPQDLALLEDRVLMHEGKKQRYGSQLQPNGKGGYEFYPIEDEVRVDERRKAVGLPPLSEYAKLFGLEYRPK